jgi:DNA-binding GntR family transcriptional regulator
MRYRCIMSATDRAYAFAKERILDGRFPAGSSSARGDVAAGVSLSRTPVREAFLRLESEGLLRLYPKRGALVVPVSAAEVESVLETRMVVERFAFEKVIRARTDLGGAPRRPSPARRSSPPRATPRASWRPTAPSTASSSPRRPTRSCSRSTTPCATARPAWASPALARGPHRTEQILLEHRRLADAVAAGDEEAAHRLVGEHLGATLALLRGGPWPERRRASAEHAAPAQRAQHVPAGHPAPRAVGGEEARRPRARRPGRGTPRRRATAVR